MLSNTTACRVPPHSKATREPETAHLWQHHHTPPARDAQAEVYVLAAPGLAWDGVAQVELGLAEVAQREVGGHRPGHLGDEWRRNPAV